MRFEWDPRKAKANLRTHGVSFNEASTVFEDPRGKLRFDTAHSDFEDRFVQLGCSDRDRLLLVWHCYRHNLIRIISARQAEPADEIEYFEGDQMSTHDWKPNPYFEQLSEELTFRLDFRSIEYFEELGKPYGLPAQDMIRMYLRHLAGSGYKANLGILTLKQREALRKSLEAEGKLPLVG